MDIGGLDIVNVGGDQLDQRIDVLGANLRV